MKQMIYFHNSYYFNLSDTSVCTLGHSSVQITLDTFVTALDKHMLVNVKMLKSKLQG